MANTHSLDLELDSSQYLTVPYNAALEPADISIEVWVKVETLGINQYLVGHNNEKDSYNVAYGLWIDSNNKVNLLFQSLADATRSITSNTALTSGWHHIAVTYDGNTAAIYLDGSSTADITNTGAQEIYYGGANKISVGVFLDKNDAVAGYYYDGLIDDLRIWNDVRSGAEVAANYNTELVGNEAGLILYLKLNNNVTDSGPGGYTVTAVNSPTYSEDRPMYDVSPSPSSSLSASPSLSSTPSSSVSASPSTSSSSSPSPSSSPSASISASPSVSVSASLSASPSSSKSASPSVSISSSVSASPSGSISASPSPSSSPSSSESVSVSASPSASVSASPSSSLSASLSSSISSSPSSSSSASVSSSVSSSISASPSQADYDDLYSDQSTSYSDQYTTQGTIYTDLYREF